MYYSSHPAADMRPHRIRCVLGCTRYVSTQCLSVSLFSMIHMRHAGHQGQSRQDSTQSEYNQYPGAPPKRTGGTGGGAAGQPAGPANGGVPMAFGVGRPRQDGASPPSTGAAGTDQQPLQQVVFASPRMHASLISFGMKCGNSRHYVLTLHQGNASFFSHGRAPTCTLISAVSVSLQMLRPQGRAALGGGLGAGRSVGGGRAGPASNPPRQAPGRGLGMGRGMRPPAQTRPQMQQQRPSARPQLAGQPARQPAGPSLGQNGVAGAPNGVPSQLQLPAAAGRGASAPYGMQPSGAGPLPPPGPRPPSLPLGMQQLNLQQPSRPGHPSGPGPPQQAPQSLSDGPPRPYSARPVTFQQPQSPPQLPAQQLQPSGAQPPPLRPGVRPPPAFGRAPPVFGRRPAPERNGTSSGAGIGSAPAGDATAPPGRPQPGHMQLRRDPPSHGGGGTLQTDLHQQRQGARIDNAQMPRPSAAVGDPKVASNPSPCAIHPQTYALMHATRCTWVLSDAPGRCLPPSQ